MKILYAKVSPGGVLWLATPNVDSPLRFLEGRYWSLWETPRHLQMFNTKSLRLLIESVLGKDAKIVFKRRGWHMYWSMAQSARLRHGRLRGIRPRISLLKTPLAILLECAVLLACRWGDELVIKISRPEA